MKKRIHTPTVIQMEAVECGAAALGIVLAYFGKFVPLEVLRQKCGVSRDGSNAYNLIQAAEAYGVKAQGFKAEIEDLKEMSLPLIVFWSFNHFVVVEGFSPKWVYINDPASGPRKVSYKEFDEDFTGVVITLEPTASFVKSGTPPRLMPMLKERLYGSGSPLFYICLAGLLLVIPGIAVPAFTQLFFDQVLKEQRLSWITIISTSLFSLSVIVAAITWLQHSILARFYTKLSSSLTTSFLWHILRLPMSFYAQRFSGEIAHRISINEQIANILTTKIAASTVSISLILFYALIMFQYNVTITLISIVAALLNLVLLWVINRSRNDAYSRVQQESGKSIGFAIGALQNIESIKACGNEADLFSKWAGYYAKRVNAQREINLKDIILTAFPPFLQNLATIALLGIGAWKVLQGELTIGMLLALQALLLTFLAPVAELVNLGSLFQTMKIDVSRIDDVMKNQIDPVLLQQAQKKEMDATRLQGYLEFRNVTFGYSPLDPPLIENLSFSLKPGQRLALVGPAGCGKSTIANLANGLYVPWSGQILFDGLERKEIPLSMMQNSLSSVDQRIFLFAGTLKENLSLWDTTMSDQDLVEGAKDAYIHEEIIARQYGYEAEVSEGGSNWSGGQRQRFEIARALAKNPRILVLDEATSSLDSKTEEIISKNIRKRGCTCIMIAHRLSTIQECDEILVLDLGKIVQRGTHEELKSQPGLYRELVEKEL